MVRTINNFLITIEDVRNDNTIYRCNVTIFKGKRVPQQPNSVQGEYIEVPESTKESIGNLTVEDDVMFVNGIAFVVSISRWGQFHISGIC